MWQKKLQLPVQLLVWQQTNKQKNHSWVGGGKMQRSTSQFLCIIFIFIFVLVLLNNSVALHRKELTWIEGRGADGKLVRYSCGLVISLRTSLDKMDYVALRSLEPEHLPIKGVNHSLVPGYSQERLITVIGSYDKQQVHLQDPGQVQKAARLKIRFLQ